MKFIDYVTIKIKSGAGGDGCVSFRREKYVPNGGPDGGDGGNGGDIVAQVDPGINSLSDFRKGKVYKAQNGEPGRGSRCHGKNGKSLVLKVPKGTVIRELSSNLVMADMSDDNLETVLLKGGNGGLGNQHFATSRMQAPKYAKPGGEARELEISLELKLIADVGLVGFPNAGKSTLLSVMSNAKPKIADYPFTTLSPMLGVVDMGDGNSFIMADIPGLIKGASENIGLGHDFLKHIERNRLILHVVDASDINENNPIDSINTINAELSKFSRRLSQIPQIIVLNKSDLGIDKKLLKKVESTFNCSAVQISAATGQGIPELKALIIKTINALPKEHLQYETEYEYVQNDILGFEINKNEDGEFEITGPKIEKMLGYTNLESERGYLFFTNFLKKEGIEDALVEAGINEGDTVVMYGNTFSFYK